MPKSERQKTETIVLDWAKAVSAGDRDGILAHHTPDVLMFDFPDTVRGIEAYARTWDFFFDQPKGPITYAPRNLVATAGQDVAFATCEMHCDGTSAGPLDFRLTIGFERQGGEWVITHEHHSVPTIGERIIERSANGCGRRFHSSSLTQTGANATPRRPALRTLSTKPPVT